MMHPTRLHGRTCWAGGVEEAGLRPQVNKFEQVYSDVPCPGRGRLGETELYSEVPCLLGAGAVQ